MSAHAAGYQGAVFLVPEYPWPSTSGGRVRAANIAAALGKVGPLTVVAPDAPASAGLSANWMKAGSEHQRRRASIVLRLYDVGSALILGRHVAVLRASRAGGAEAFRSILAELRPSVVVLGRPFLGPFIDSARWTGAAVIAEVDESFDKVARSVLTSNVPFAKRFRATYDVLSARRMETTDLHRVDQVWVSSTIEAAELRRSAGSVPVAVIPSGAQTWPAAVPEPPPLSALGFVGYYAHPPNAGAAKELIELVLPAVRSAGGPRGLVLIGRDPTPTMVAAARKDSAITVTGVVQDPSAILREAGVLVMPIRSGAGTRIKALDAITAGVPIVSTEFGVQGLALRPGLDFLLAETPDQFASAIAELHIPGRSQRLTTSAFARTSGTQSPAAVASGVRTALADAGVLPQSG